MAWFYLILAGIFEIGFASTLKLTENFTKLFPSIIFISCTVLSFHFLQKAITKIPVGTAYAIWTGIGAIGAVLVGIFYYKEDASLLKLFFLSTLIISVVGLKFTANH